MSVLSPNSSSKSIFISRSIKSIRRHTHIYLFEKMLNAICFAVNRLF